MQVHDYPVFSLADVVPTSTQEPLTYDQPVGQLDVVDDARWSVGVTNNSWTALVVWIVMLCILQAVSWPLVKQVFRRFPDRGWAFGRLVTMLLAGYGVWLFASIELIAFRVVWCLAAVLIVGVACLAYGALLTSAEERKRRGHDDRPSWRPATCVIAAEAIFWGVFALFLVFRLINPDSYHPNWGGEKPMEFAHINAVLRSPHFPPIDPWYADGILNYYYYGAYLVAFLLKLTGIPTEIGFNLAQPTFIALLATGAFSVAAAFGHRIARTTSLTLLTGLIGAILVSFAGNLLVASRIVTALFEDAPPLSSYLYWFWIPTRVIPSTVGQFTITEFPYFTGVYADLHAHVVALPMTVLIIGLGFALALEWRTVSSVILRSARNRLAALRLAGHFGLLALTLGSLFPTNAWDVPTYSALTAVAVFMACKGMPSLWKRLVTAFGIVGGIALLAYALVLPFTRNYVALFGTLDTVREKTPLLAIETHLGVFLLIIVFGFASLFSRRARHRSEMLDPFVLTPLLGSLLVVRLIGAQRAAQFRDIADALIVMFVGAVLLSACAICLRSSRSPIRGGVFVGWLVVLVAVVSMVVLTTGRPVLAMFLGIAGTASIAWLVLPDDGERFVAAMIAAAMFVGAGLEIVYLVDDLSSLPYYRMNTVFKFYNGIWILLALSSAALVGRMFSIASVGRQPPPTSLADGGDAESVPRESDAIDGEMPSREQAASREPADQSPNWSRVGIAVASLAIAASLAFPVFSTGVRLDQHFTPHSARWTLNAFDWMDYGTIQTQRDEGGVATLSYAEDRAVIEWFNADVPGTPVISEASINAYICGSSRISVGTGLPVVLGWFRHEQQQRYQTHLDERRDDLRTLYTSESLEEKREIISKYRIEYIVVGVMERNYPANDCTATDPSEGIDVLEDMVGRDLEVAFRAGETVVYRVAA